MPMTFTTSDYDTVALTSREMPLPMISGMQYVLRSNVDIYFKIGATGAVTAAAADDNHYLAAGMPAYVAARGTLQYIATIGVTSTGVVTCSRLEPGQI